MCGFLAIVQNHLPISRDKAVAGLRALAHRGPDGEGHLFLNENGMCSTQADQATIYLGHRRLAIIDLSANASQPFSSPDGQVHLLFNGAIYNYRELRKELIETHKVQFRSHSDTEVVLHSYRVWGEQCVKRFNGMFAIVILDQIRKCIFAARDRYGIKPLYYCQKDHQILFASEIKAIQKYLGGKAQVSSLYVNEYFSFQNGLSNRTIFDGIYLMEAGTQVSLKLSALTFSPDRYWDYNFVPDISLSEREVEEQISDLIEKAVRRQCVCDVEVGAYLSGGMDSGTVTALASSSLSSLRTFTAGFDLSSATAQEINFDERKPAQILANILGTQHHEVEIHAGDMEAVMDQLIWHLEELRVGQCYPNYYAAQLAAQHSKVVLSGVGGDELFGGYPWRYAAAMSDDGNGYVEDYYHYWQRIVRDQEKRLLFKSDFQEQIDANCFALNQKVETHPKSVFSSIFPFRKEPVSNSDKFNWSLYFECKTFLHGILLVEDKISMAHGLETRVPFLDNDLVDFAMRIPMEMKISLARHSYALDENLPRKKVARYQQGLGKLILRKSMEKFLPLSYTQARKQGFSGPDESWFRGQSEGYLRGMLQSEETRIYEYLEPGFVKNIINEHCSGNVNKRLMLWSFLCFEIWLRRFA